jgi:hypothetical protein
MEMNKMKALVLGLIAAAALLATVGAGTASATETALCKEKTTNASGQPECSEFHIYPAGTVIHAEAETFILIESALGKIECEQSTIKATTEQKTAKPLGAKVEALTFGKENKCGATTVETVEKGTLDIELIDFAPEWTHNGTLTFTGTKIKTIQMGVECFYTLGDAGTLTGGATGTIDLSGTLTRVGGGFVCPEKASVIGFYKVTSPAPLWVSM